MQGATFRNIADLFDVLPESSKPQKHSATSGLPIRSSSVFACHDFRGSSRCTAYGQSAPIFLKQADFITVREHLKWSYCKRDEAAIRVPFKILGWMPVFAIELGLWPGIAYYMHRIAARPSVVAARTREAEFPPVE